ncbi:hypothetical protein BASA81_016447 [Batrachochytrium salamandrivorans]|nr:hypothetical protein BASA81_016447 [Batrachochytrium salamandrivorans]
MLVLSLLIVVPTMFLWIPNLPRNLRFLLTNFPNPIMLRLADGDSSSTLTHRTVPTAAAHWKACGDSVVLRHQSLTNEPCVQDASDSGEEILPGPVSTWTLDSIHSDVYPFLDASPDSNSSIPDDILKEFTSVFSKKQSEKLPIHREFDCTIDLVPNAAPHHGKIYQLTQEEDKVMQDWIAENLAKGFIRNSSSPHGAPCFFVKQKDKTTALHGLQRT